MAHRMHQSGTGGDILTLHYKGKLMKILSMEMTKMQLASGVTNPKDCEKLLLQLKMLPSYQRLLRKLKDRTEKIVRSLGSEQVERLVQILDSSTAEAGDDCCATLGEISNIFAVNQTDSELCFELDDDQNENRTSKNEGELEEEDTNDDEDKRSTESGSQGSSLTICGRSPTERDNFGHVATKTGSLIQSFLMNHRNSPATNGTLEGKEDVNDPEVPHPSESAQVYRKQQQQLPQGKPYQQHRQQKQSQQKQSILRRPPLQISQSFSDVESSFSSCLNQSGFTVLNQDQLVTLAAALDRNQSHLVNRQQALRHLVHLPIIDIQACEAWSTPVLTADEENKTALTRDDSPAAQNFRASEKSGEWIAWMDSVNLSVGKGSRDTDSRPSHSNPLVSGGNLRSGLADALNDSDETLWSLALRYISKGLSTTPPNILETYGLLMDHLTFQFKRSGKKLPLVRDGLNTARYPIDRLLRACHLMDQFHRTITHYWIRHSEKFLNEIIIKCVNVLSIGCPDVDTTGPFNVADKWPDQLIPMHLLSLIDPQACWFSKWMHGAYSRVPLVDRLKQNKKIINLMVSALHRFLRKNTKPIAATVGPAADTIKALEYTSAELEYALFLHTINMFYRLLCHSVSWSLFAPQGTAGSTSPRSVLVLVRMMLDYLQNQNPSRNLSDSGTSPFYMITKCLVELAKNPRFGASCFVQDSGQPSCQISDGSQPIIKLITGLLNLFPSKVNGAFNLMDPARMTKAVEFTNILRNLAAHSQGREILHRCEIPNAQSQSFVGCLLYAVHGMLSLDNSWGSTDRSLELLTSLIDLCGLLNTLSSNGNLEGVFPVYHLISQSWKILAPQIAKNSTSWKKASLVLDSNEWYLVLKRNLIQVAESPVGVLILEQEDLLDECGIILHTAHRERIRCPWIRSHFCGLILTQMASRTSSARALRVSGLLRRLISDAWKAIEFPQGPNLSVDEVDAYQSASVTSSPPNWPIDPIDKCAYKPFINLVKVTSSFSAVAFFMLTEQKEEKSSACCYPSFPESLRKFLDRSVILNTEEKMRSLYNLEQTHTFGLRLLACIVSDLDSMLLLCTQFDLLHVLIQMQLDTFAPNAQGHTSLDALVLERNYLLVKCYFCGGPTERSLPNRFLCEHGTNPYPHPLIVRPPNVDDPAIQAYFISTSRHKLYCDRFPCKSWYENLFPSPTSLRGDNPYPIVSKLLAALQQCPYLADRLIDSPESAVCCYEHCNRIMSEFENKNAPDCICLGNDLDTAILLQNCLLLRQYATEFYEAPKFDRLSDDPDSYQATDLTPFEVFGVETAVRYGQRIGVLAHDSLHPLTDSGHVASLTSLLKRVRCGLVQERQRRGIISPETGPTDTQFQAWSDSRGFDWFSATIFLAFHGDANRAWEFLAQFASDSLSVYIWPHRGQTYAEGFPGDSTWKWSSLQITGHFVDHILALECPTIYNTFVLAELPPSQIAKRWVKQCFWNYLDWNGIMDYVILCLIHPKPYHHVYFVLAVLRHLRHAIRLATAQSPTNQQQQPQQLAVFLQEEPIRGFQASEHLDFFALLHSKYGEKLSITIAQNTTPEI